MSESVTLVNTTSVWLSRFEIISAAILFVCDMVFILNKRKSSKQEKYLYAILMAVAVLLVMDVVVLHYFGDTSTFARVLEEVGNLLFFLCNNLAVWLMVHYAFELVKKNGGAVHKWLILVCDGSFVFAILTLLLNLLYEKVYYIDEFNMYQRGDCFLVAIFPAAIMLCVLAIVGIKYKSKLLISERLIIFAYVILPVIAEVLEIVDYGLSWQPLAMTFSAFLITAQNIVSRFHLRAGEHAPNVDHEGKVLQTRIIIFVCVLITLFFGIIAKIAIGFASKQMNKEIEAHYQMLANKTTEQVSAWIVKETQILLNQKATLEIMDDFSQEFLSEYFAHIVSEYNYDKFIYDLYFVDTENVMVAGSGYIQDPNIDFRTRAWYQGALSSDNLCYTVPYVDVDTGKYIVTVSIRVFDRERRFRGVLALDIFVEKLFDITYQQDIPENSYLFIAGQDMEIVTHPNENYGFLQEEPQNLLDVDCEGYSSLVEAMQNEKEEKFVSFKDYDGMHRSFFSSKVDDCEWYVVAAISQNVIDQSRRNMSESIFIALIICLILGIILTLWATNSVIRKLTEAQEEANAASEAKSRFLANMSHEIRTPINAVLGMDEILLRECKDDSLKEYARNIQSAGQALLGVVNDILDFSKIESDRLELAPGVYVLGELVGSCVNLIRLRSEDKGLQFTVERDAYIPKKLYGDEVRVRQIISNLLTNAVKYTKEGTVTLFVGWKNTGDDHGELLIRVSDTGIGIKPENMEDLFTSFQRLDEKKNRNIEGTGLGLTITKQLAEMMGGTIQVESTYGKGSEFTVRIPQQIVNSDNAMSFAVSQEEQNKDSHVVLKTKDAKILVVDDVPMNLQVVKGLLKDTGIFIDTAERGRTAINLIAKNHYDVVFLDHMMPELDGIQTLNILKEEYVEALGNTPVIMLTANAILGVEEEYRKQGFSGYLSKPVDRDSLCDCLLSFLPIEKIAGDEEINKEEINIKEISIKETSQSETNLERKENDGLEEAPIDSSEVSTENPLDYLKANIEEYDLEQALQYCGGMEDILLEIIDEYCKSNFEEKLVSTYEAKDMANYRIAAHSLKGTSLTIGCTKLSEAAKGLEFAARDEDATYVETHHEEVLNLYRKILSVLKTVR